MTKSDVLLFVILICFGVFLTAPTSSIIAGVNIFISASVDKVGADKMLPTDIDDESSINTPSEEEGYDDLQDGNYDHQAEDEEDNDMKIL